MLDTKTKKTFAFMKDTFLKVSHLTSSKGNTFVQILKAILSLHHQDFYTVKLVEVA